MSKKWINLLLLVSVAVVVCVIGVEVRDQNARAAKLESEILKNLSEAELDIILANQSEWDRESVDSIRATPESRRAFLEGLRQHLALAAEARREGLADDSNFLLNFEFKKNNLLADMYRAKLSKELQKPYAVPDDEMNAVWTDPENEQRFKREIEAIRSIQRAAALETGRSIPPTILQGEALDKARASWARTRVLVKKAQLDTEFIGRQELDLRFKILEAGVLSSDYLRKHWSQKIKATDNEIEQYLKAHPEFDLSKKLDMAKAVLARAIAGEDIAELAKQYSEHRPTKAAGGLFSDLSTDQIWPELERAALELNPGQVADKLVTTEMGWHILRLEKKVPVKSESGASSVSFSLRHILFQSKFEDPNSTDPDIPPPFLKPYEIALSAVEAQKREDFINAVVKRNDIQIPEAIAD